MNEQSQILSGRLAAVVCPVLVVAIFQFVMYEPANAKASLDTTEFLELPLVPQWIGSTEEIASKDYETSSPFWYEDIELQLPVMPFEPVPLEARPSDPDPVFVLTAVLPSENKSFAVINNKPRSQGDLVAKGWTLHKISGKDRYVILKHTSGRRLRVMMNKN